MTAFDILNFNRELLMRMLMLGLKPEDCKYLEMYAEFDQMRRNGEKVTYAVSALSTKYNMSERGMYKIIKRLSKDCTTSSVQ